MPLMFYPTHRRTPQISASLACASVAAMEPKASVGRIVHFNNGSEKREAALVVAVNDGGTVNLVVWNASGTQRSQTSVLQGTESGSWEWPTRV